MWWYQYDDNNPQAWLWLVSFCYLISDCDVADEPGAERCNV